LYILQGHCLMKVSQTCEHRRKLKINNKTFNISGVTVFGPLEENAAMDGAGFVPNFAVGVEIYPRAWLLIFAAHKN